MEGEIQLLRLLLLYSLLFLIGTVCGSFITCCAERCVSGRAFGGTARSRCPHCQHQLRFWQLIPLLGILLQRGRCRDCGGFIDLRSSYVETLCGSLLLVSWSLNNGFPLPLLLGYGVLLFNSLTDYLAYQVYPATLILPAGFGLLSCPPQFDNHFWLLVGLLVGLALLACWTTSLGLGDVDVLLLIGCLSPPAVVITSLMVASIGALIAFSCMQRRRRLPFVPFITWGFILCTQFGGSLGY